MNVHSDLGFLLGLETEIHYMQHHKKLVRHAVHPGFQIPATARVSSSKLQIKECSKFLEMNFSRLSSKQ